MIVGATRKRFWVAAFIGLAVFAYTIKRADFEKLVQHAEKIDLVWGALVLLSSALSYVCIAAVLHRLLKGVGYSLSFASTFKISLLSCTLNYLMALGGLSGVAAKVYLLSKEKIPPSNTLSISMVHGFLTNTVAVVFIYLGFFFLYSEYKMGTREKEAGLVVLLIAFLLTWITIQTIVHEAFRKGAWRLLLKGGNALCRLVRRPQWINRERAEIFFDNFNRSMNLLMRKAGVLVIPATLALLDWALMFLCLKLSFLAVHYPVDNRSLLLGFSVGIFTSLFSITPAALGLMEGSMAGSFYLMGLDYDYALLATLIYRIAYYFLPIFTSFFFYRRFFAPAKDKGKPGISARET
ncbi:MAG: flippase-like domain-containing protein [Syntrophobacteraceae bacterium]|nr:flippase-like domain-containing protein [Syntrophobacteraceae bacterium]